jgi:hypothetical protein
MTVVFILKEEKQLRKRKEKREKRGKKATEKANVLSYNWFDAEMRISCVYVRM